MGEVVLCRLITAEGAEDVDVGFKWGHADTLSVVAMVLRGYSPSDG